MAPQFERGFLRDEFGIRAKLGIPDLPMPGGRTPIGNGGASAELLLQAGDFVAWYKRAAPVLASRRNELPTVYQVWLHRADTDTKTGRAVYFEARGEQYSVFASLTPAIMARKLPAGWLREKLLPAQKQSTGYAQTVIPRVEDHLSGVGLRPPDIDGNIPISPQGFEDLFLGSDVELEALPFADVFARELHELTAAAVHAKTCGLPLHLRHF
jgi:hypothetical protein